MLARLPSIDVLRITVVALIVYRHTFPAGDDQALLATVSIPFFFFLTGWLWRPGRRTVAGEIRNRWSTLGVPYLVWLAIIWVAFVSISAAQGRLGLRAAIVPFLGGEYAGRPFTTFWFISAICFSAVIMRTLDAAPRRVLVIVMVSALALGSLAGPVVSKVPLAAGAAVACLFFVIAGRLAREIWPSPSGARTLSAVTLLAIAVLASLPLAHIDIKYGDFGTPFLSAIVAVVITWAAIVILDAMFSLLPAVSAALSGPLGVVAPVAILVVLVHPAVLYLLGAPTVGAPAWVFFVALLVPWAGAVLLEHTPLSKLLLGRTRRKRSELVTT